MTKKIFILFLSFTLVFSPVDSRADMWGGDLVFLAQILSNAIQQLIQLKNILKEGEDSLNLMRDINRGINDSLNLIRTAYPNVDPGIYKEWDKVQQAIQEVEKIYGIVVPSLEAPIQKDTDQSVAEAISLNNSIYKYTKDIDEVGETIKLYSHSVSPGGAQKLTAQSLGIILNVMNQSLRAQATGLKIQAQALAIQNHKDKELTKNTIENANALSTSMTAQDTTYELPRL